MLSSQKDSPPPPDAARLERALKERIYLLGPAPSNIETACSFLVSGQSGKVYTTTLHIAPSTAMPRCNCPDHIFRKSVCKHLLFVGARVLKLPHARLGRPTLTPAQADTLAASSAALAAAGAHAAPEVLRDSASRVLGPLTKGGAKRVAPREPEPDEECPVCFERLAAEPVVHCGYGCGRGVHEECFRRYVAATKGPPRCVLCRTAWAPPSTKQSGRYGYLAGRRLVDLSLHVPEAFIDPVILPRARSAPRGRRGAGDGAEAVGAVGKRTRAKVAKGKAGKAGAKTVGVRTRSGAGGPVAKRASRGKGGRAAGTGRGKGKSGAGASGAGQRGGMVTRSAARRGVGGE